MKNIKTQTTHVCNGHTAPIRALACLSTKPTSKDFAGMEKIITGSSDHTIRIWDKKSGICDQTLQGHNQAITDVIAPYVNKKRCQALIASASKDGKICIWRYNTPQDLVALFKGAAKEETIDQPVAEADYDLADCSLFNE